MICLFCILLDLVFRIIILRRLKGIINWEVINVVIVEYILVFVGF